MIKYVMLRLSLLLFFVLPLHAMEQVCYLNKMPKEALDRIAYFLGWETKEAFIKRTAQHSHRTLRYCNKVSSDKTKRAILNRDKDKEWPISVTVFNIQNKAEVKIVFNILFSLSYRFTALNFNQQGTHLLVWFLQCDPQGREHKKRMFLALNPVYKSRLDKERDTKEEDVLQDYLRHHLVCKKY